MMVVAAVRGLLVPIEPNDRIGVLRESILIRQLHREASAEVAKMRFARHAAAAQYMPGDEECEIFKYHWDESMKDMMSYLGYVQPWVDWEARVEELREADRRKDVKTWEDAFGSLEDPDIAAENERLAEWLRADGVVEVDEFADM